MHNEKLAAEEKEKRKRDEQAQIALQKEIRASMSTIHEKMALKIREAFRKAFVRRKGGGGCNTA